MDSDGNGDNEGGMDDNGMNGIPGGVRPQPKGDMAVDANNGEKKPGALCSKAGEPKQYFDNCLVCGGDNSQCNSAGTLGVSLAALAVAACARAL